MPLANFQDIAGSNLLTRAKWFNGQKGFGFVQHGRLFPTIHRLAFRGIRLLHLIAGSYSKSSFCFRSKFFAGVADVRGLLKRET